MDGHEGPLLLVGATSMLMAPVPGHMASTSSHRYLAAARPIPGVAVIQPEKSGQRDMRPVRTRTTSPFCSVVPCSWAVLARSPGSMQ